MVGTGTTRTVLLRRELVDKDTKFGAYANKYMDNESYTFTEGELKGLKQGWHDLYDHCLREIDRRFPPENMAVFQLLQVLDPTIIHGAMQRHRIGSKNLADAVAELLSVFEVPLYTSLAGKHSIEEIKNAFTAFRSSEYCAEIWGVHVARYARLSFDYTVVYSYYKILLEKPDVAPWAFACLLLLIFPTGNAIAERGFSAMGAVHTKQRSEMSHEQVWAHMVIQYNGPTLAAYAEQLDVESRMPNWWGHVNQSNYNL
jgi:hypothetical protein